MSRAALKKILIEGYNNSKCLGEAEDSIMAVINPKTLTRDFGVRYTSSKETGSNGETMRYANMKSSGFNLELIVDGTGVVPIPLENGKKTVDNYLAKLKRVIYDYKGIEHRPSYIKITWGGRNFTGVCERLSIQYTLFKPDGTALRALVKMAFTETVDFDTKMKEANKNSPDLTHVRTVKAGDNLPLMAYRIYRDSSYYLEVAKANGLNSFLAVSPGDQLFFPPIKR